jgi:hypothetical protein
LTLGLLLALPLRRTFSRRNNELDFAETSYSTGVKDANAAVPPFADGRAG